MAEETDSPIHIPIPLLEPDIGTAEKALVQQCLTDNWVSSAGPYVADFEQQIAELCGRKYAIATASGTAALHLACISLQIGRDDFVIVPDWTFSATANAVIHAGATPVLVGINPENWSLDAAYVASAIDDLESLPKAVITVDPPAMVADPTWLQAVAGEYDIPIIEDAAGALGSSFNGQMAGSFGTCSTLSFNGNKILTTGGGGMLLTDEDELAERARHLSSQARVGGRYIYDDVGYNFRMPSLNAALGLGQLQRLSEMLRIKRTIFKRYQDFLQNRKGLDFMPLDHLEDSNAWMACCLAPTAEAAEDLLQHLNDHHIQARPFWERLSDQRPYQHYPCYCADDILSGRVISLPSSSTLTVAEQERVLACLEIWLEQGAGS